MIYTKKGDGGTTGLFGNRKRVLKSSPIIRAIGAVDEVNSYLGLAVSVAKSEKLKAKIYKVQEDLFAIGAILAGAKDKNLSLSIKKLENGIDKMEAKLPAQKNFILPGGTRIAAHLMYARTLVRRAERELVALKSHSVFRYMNRLSDYLFILARWENFKRKIKETVWRG